MRTMNSRSRVRAVLAAGAALAVLATGCGGTTVEGEAPEVAPQTSSTPTSTPFIEERPVEPESSVSPPPPPPEEPEPRPDAEPEPEPAPDEPPPPAPGGGDFVGLLQQNGIAMPEGVDPVATATEACERFDRGQPMTEVSGWLGERGALDLDQQGFFLGAAVGTYCPHNFPKLG
ncbi:MAG TPA: DUF732 domain-containing protein [Actinomycetales bacterium]|nr:DUF732 domain-containing protein [Actinomycetales bacterium]